jgi:hypothetical protein
MSGLIATRFEPASIASAGPFVATLLGVDVGSAVGVADAVAVGAALAPADGEAVGCAPGDADGDGMADAVGAAECVAVADGNGNGDAEGATLDGTLVAGGAPGFDVPPPPEHALAAHAANAKNGQA